jgi:SAM-dependent methyltransferase
MSTLRHFPANTAFPSLSAARTQAAVRDACPACGTPPGRPFFEVPAAPVLCNVQHASADQARAAARGKVALVLCGCGLIYNRAFDPALIGYSPAYENALHFSGVFRAYEQRVAATLAQAVGSGRALDIGCGDGHFLATLCSATGGQGLGMDPAFDARRAPADLPAGVRFLPRGCTLEDLEAFRPRLVCCRHVLEHLHDPLALLRIVRRGLAGVPGALVFFEAMLGGLGAGGFWDVLYEHVAYYTPASLTQLFRVAGFEPLRVEEEYGGQFLTITALPLVKLPGRGGWGRKTADPELATRAARFGERYRRSLWRWRATLEVLREEGRGAAVWGAGTKGVMFLNALGEYANAVTRVFDASPRKQGRFVAGTGHRIDDPASLAAGGAGAGVDLVLLMNPQYEQEVRAVLDQHGCAADLRVVAASVGGSGGSSGRFVPRRSSHTGHGRGARALIFNIAVTLPPCRGGPLRR